MSVYYAKYGTAWDLHGYPLVDRATGQYKSSPTLASGDFKIEKDGGAAANLATLPSVVPVAGVSIKIPFSAAEMQAKQITVRMQDVAGAEWNDDCIHIFTVGDPSAAMQLDTFAATVGVSAASKSDIVASVWSAQRSLNDVAGSFGEGVASVQGDVTGDVLGDVAGNVDGNVGGSVAALAANSITQLTFAAEALNADKISQGFGQKIADEILNRNLAGGGSGNSRNVRNALRSLRNRVRVNGGTLEIYQEDDSTLAWTAVSTTTAGNPITEIDPS